jgi:uncharacterized repeat protein (TIGR01451 family)
VLSKTSDVSQLAAGGLVTYLIRIENQGPSPVVGARVEDTLPEGIADAAWSCSGTCDPSTGTGDVDVLVDLLAGEVAFVAINARVADDFSGDLTNVVAIDLPDGVLSLDPEQGESESSIVITPRPQAPPLADTGTDAAPVIALGVAVIVVGLALMVVAVVFRRRRARR